MSADVLREGLHADVHAVREGVEQHTGGVGVVERHGDASRPCGGDDGRHVLHLHRDRARALAPDQRRAGSDQLGDAAPDQRIVTFDLDAQAREQALAQFGGRPIRTLGNEHVRARAAVRQVHERQRGLSPWRHEAVVRAVERRDAQAEFQRGRRAVSSLALSVLPRRTGHCPQRRSRTRGTARMAGRLRWPVGAPQVLAIPTHRHFPRAGRRRPLDDHALPFERQARALAVVHARVHGAPPARPPRARRPSSPTAARCRGARPRPANTRSSMAVLCSPWPWTTSMRPSPSRSASARPSVPGVSSPPKTSSRAVRWPCPSLISSRSGPAQRADHEVRVAVGVVVEERDHVVVLADVRRPAATRPRSHRGSGPCRRSGTRARGGSSRPRRRSRRRSSSRGRGSRRRRGPSPRTRSCWCTAAGARGSSVNVPAPSLRNRLLPPQRLHDTSTSRSASLSTSASSRSHEKRTLMSGIRASVASVKRPAPSLSHSRVRPPSLVMLLPGPQSARTRSRSPSPSTSPGSRSPTLSGCAGRCVRVTSRNAPLPVPEEQTALRLVGRADDDVDEAVAVEVACLDRRAPGRAWRRAPAWLPRRSGSPGRC